MSSLRTGLQNGEASSRGHYSNSGNGPLLQPVSIGHPKYVGLVDPETAFWSLIKKEMLGDVICDPAFMNAYRRKSRRFAREIEHLRFGLTPSAVYLNPTERCNLDCSYCYIPRKMRRTGKHMKSHRLQESLRIAGEYFTKTVPRGVRPQIIFHGAEPLLNRDAVFEAIEAVSYTHLRAHET